MRRTASRIVSHAAWLASDVPAGRPSFPESALAASLWGDLRQQHRHFWANKSTSSSTPATSSSSCAATTTTTAAAVAQEQLHGVIAPRAFLSRWKEPVSVPRGSLALLFFSGMALGSVRSGMPREQPGHEPESESVFEAAQSAVFGLFTPLRALSHAPDTAPHPTPTAAPSQPLAGCLSPFFISDAAAKAAPAVVNILVQQDGSLPVGSSGSGFVVTPDGTILTNAHVVADAINPRQPLGAANSSALRIGAPSALTGASSSEAAGGPPATRSIAVTLQDGRIFEAQLVSYDTVSDLAVLRVNADGPLPAARLGSSAGLRVGEWVVALGSPLHLQNSVTAGIISCVGRKGIELGLAGARTDYIQTDASINRGSSGGPLVNLSGEVIGVSCMKALAADGVSFAIPIDTVRDVVHQLETHGRVIRPYIGVKLLQLNRHNAAQLRRRDPSFPAVDGGVAVPHVQPGSPAEKAGLKQGDVIVRYGREAREATTAGLIRALEGAIGKELRLVVARPDGAGGSNTVVLSVSAEEARSN